MFDYKSPMKSTSKTTFANSRFFQSTIMSLIGIKCIQCNLIFPTETIEEHLITHIQPKFLMPRQENSGAKKLHNNLLLTE